MYVYRNEAVAAQFQHLAVVPQLKHVFRKGCTQYGRLGERAFSLLTSHRFGTQHLKPQLLGRRTQAIRGERDVTQLFHRKQQRDAGFTFLQTGFKLGTQLRQAGRF